MTIHLSMKNFETLTYLTGYSYGAYCWSDIFRRHSEKFDNRKGMKELFYFSQ